MLPGAVAQLPPPLGAKQRHTTMR